MHIFGVSSVDWIHLQCKQEQLSNDWITVLVCIADVDHLTTVSTVTSDYVLAHMTNGEDLIVTNIENVNVIDIFLLLSFLLVVV